MNFYETKYKLNSKIKETLLQQAISTNFKQFMSQNGTQTDLFVASTKGKQIVETNETRFLRSIINPKFDLTTVVFLKLMPNDTAEIHIDESPYRVTSLAWALSPEIDKFAPITYYKDDWNTVNEIKYYNDLGILLNNKTIHSVHNNNYVRISVQLSFTNSIEELALADLNDKLFVK